MKRKFEKDLERYENLIKQDQNDSVRIRRQIEKRKKEYQEEIERQEKIGIVTKPKKLGRFKYKQRKLDYQLEEDLSGNLR